MNLSKALADVGDSTVTLQVTGTALGNVTSSPLALSPSFAGSTTDYVLRCQSGINTIQLTLNAVSSTRLAFTPAVPEPGVLALLGIGLMGLFATTRRKTLS